MSKKIEPENITVLFQMYNNLSDTEKEMFLTRISNVREEAGNILSEQDIVKECPHCHSKHFIKYGHKGNHQSLMQTEPNLITKRGNHHRSPLL